MKMLHGYLLVSTKEEKIEKKNNIFIIKEHKPYKEITIEKSNCDSFKKGDTFYLPKASGKDVFIEGNKYLIVHRGEII